MPKVSVNIVCHNEGKYLPSTVASILAQTYQNWELIIVDDGSSDEYAQVLDELAKSDPRIKTIRTVHGGISAARNICLAASTGDYIALHDASDQSMPERLARQVEFLESHPSIALVGAQLKWFFETPDDGVEIFRYPSTTEGIDRRFKKGNMGVPHAASMVRRGVFESVGGYDESLPRAVDLHLYLRVHQKHAMATLEEPLYAYRVASTPTLSRFRLLRRCHRYAIACSHTEGSPAIGWFSDYCTTIERRPATRIANATLDTARFIKMRWAVRTLFRPGRAT